MLVDIFIRTYAKDLEWLKYCLRSIHKYVDGYRDIIISIPDKDAHLLKEFNLTKERVVSWKPKSKDGYIDQQINKLMAHTLTDADYILYVDSDVCFYRQIDVAKEYFVNGKPYLMKTNYNLVGDAICWKKPTEEILGFELEYEYMRRIPCLYSIITLASLDKLVNCSKLAKLNRLSEFNLIGAYVDHYENHLYHIIDTEKDEIPKECAKQLWSWSGCNEEDRQKMEELLK
jgi:hypothetical protein